MTFRLWLSLLYFAVSITTPQAENLCEAVALYDLHSVGEPLDASILRRGEHQAAITRYSVNRKTGDGSFCSRGACYQTHTYVNGTKVEALRFVNCKIGLLSCITFNTDIAELVAERFDFNISTWAPFAVIPG